MPTERVQAKDRTQKVPRPKSVTASSSESESDVEISDLLKAVGYLAKSNVDKIHRAYCFSNDAHSGQERISGEAYIHHPLAVACILADLQLDERSIIAAILHDVIEDTETDRDELVTKFGEDVALLVDGVTKI